MNQVSVVGPEAGEVVQLGPAAVRILKAGSTSAGRLGIAEIIVASHADGPPQHRHAAHDEGFYVVRGVARFTVGHAVHEAPAGTLLIVLPSPPHTFANAGDEPLVMLNTFTPSGYVQYFRDLRGTMHATGQDMAARRHMGDGSLRDRGVERLRMSARLVHENLHKEDQPF
jgi:mannose-6-phosphate isomerase-like protein (cupin superfamily)